MLKISFVIYRMMVGLMGSFPSIRLKGGGSFGYSVIFVM